MIAQTKFMDQDECVVSGKHLTEIDAKLVDACAFCGSPKTDTNIILDGLVARVGLYRVLDELVTNADERRMDYQQGALKRKNPVRASKWNRAANQLGSVRDSVRGLK